MYLNNRYFRHPMLPIAYCMVTTLLSAGNPTESKINLTSVSSSTASESTGSYIDFVATGIRYYHTATLLKDGSVLIAGGVDSSGQPLRDMVQCDETGRVETLPVNLPVSIMSFTSTLMKNGNVLFVGGAMPCPSEKRSNLEIRIYNPAVRNFEPMLELNTSRYDHTATLLPNGNVFIAGGFNQDGKIDGAIASTEIYDVNTRHCINAASMVTPRYGHTASLLPNGKVIIVGGKATNGSIIASAELYDPSTNTFSVVGPMINGRCYHTATMLTTGKLLIVGGYDKDAALQTSELYDWRSNCFIAANSLNRARGRHTATLLHSGNVLIAGGDDAGCNSSELYSILTDSFTPTDDMHSVIGPGRTGHTATLLPKGQVLVVGGENNTISDLFTE